MNFILQADVITSRDSCDISSFIINKYELHFQNMHENKPLHDLQPWDVIFWKRHRKKTALEA